MTQGNPGSLLLPGLENINKEQKPERYSLPVTYGPDVMFEGFLLRSGKAEESAGRRCRVSVFKTTGGKYVFYTTWATSGAGDSRIFEMEEFDNIVLTQTGTRNYIPADVLAQLISDSVHQTEVLEDPERAILSVLEQSDSDDVVVILGSHYLGPAVAAAFNFSFDIES